MFERLVAQSAVRKVKLGSDFVGQASKRAFFCLQKMSMMSSVLQTGVFTGALLRLVFISDIPRVSETPARRVCFWLTIASKCYSKQLYIASAPTVE